MNSNSWDQVWKKPRLITDYEQKWYDFLEKISEKIDLDSPIVLEVGCGSGRGLIKFAGISKIVVGLDLSDEALNLSKINLSEIGSFSLIKADAKKLPFKSDSFDLVLSSGLLEHFENPLVYLQEISRVTKKNGLTIISVPNDLCPWYFLVKQILYRFLKYPYSIDNYKTYFWAPRLEKYLVTVGLKDIEILGLQLFPPSTDGLKTFYPQKIRKIMDKIEEKVPNNLKKFLSYAIVAIGVKERRTT